ncbi:hypothetical protein SESBI_35509 [Sesbania bispinosa]|nr:hypothetical protein SESBI_35509 [Sesbania bispinosa]
MLPGEKEVNNASHIVAKLASQNMLYRGWSLRPPPQLTSILQQDKQNGHLIPLVHLARLVASRGQQVTIVTTPSNAQLFDKTIDDDRVSGHHIRVHIIQFPANKVGLPHGVENLFAASDNLTAGKIHMAAHLIQPEIEAFINQSPPDVFIPDIMFTWSEASAKRLGIPRLVFNPISIFDVCMIEAIKSHPEAFASDSGPYHIPGLSTPPL